MNAIRKVEKPRTFPARMPQTNLARYDEMCRAIAQAYEVDEVKDIRDKAQAIEIYSRQAKNVEAERQACEIRLRAERRCGQLLKEREKAKGGDHGGKPRIDGSRLAPSNPVQTLADIGISKQQSSRWQRLADVPDEEFEQALKSEQKPTTSGIIAAHSPTKESAKNAVSDDALWVWGRLLDFERRGLLDTEPREILSTMLEPMKADMQKLAPRVATWLEGCSE
jgi:hypothetical protein